MRTLKDGYALVDNVLGKDQLAALVQTLANAKLPVKAGGIRNAEKKFPAIEQLAHSAQLKTLASEYLDNEPQLVRTILFNKTASNNWLVTWHQDKTVAVSENFDHPAWGPWSLKDGCHHVQPPVEVLERMITLRIHLDDCTLDNGCLRVIPGSHRHGILTQASIQQTVSEEVSQDCPVSAGSVLVMRPHLLHASSKALNPAQRRVIHVEYSDYPLPNGINWA